LLSLCCTACPLTLTSLSPLLADVITGAELGHGEFVHYSSELSSPDLLLTPLAQKGYMKAHAQRNDKGRYAIKRARHDLSKSAQVNAVVDLACEAEFLKRLGSQHSIIRLRGTVGRQGSVDYGIVLDRLERTLEDQVQIWSRLEKSHHGGVFGVFKSQLDKNALESLWLDRLGALWDVASAIRYLHSHKIVYRDIKPDNVGVDVRGDYKLFDFGLAREVKARDLVQEPDDYNLTELTGSHRYMAPEVMVCQPYGLSADAYSFAILMWHVLALQVPFGKLSTAQIYDKVVLAGQRPHAIRKLDHTINDLMQDAWSANRRQRPSFAKICQVLEAKIGPDYRFMRVHRSFASFYENAVESECG
jgi:serine/threonine protein kinase